MKKILVLLMALLVMLTLTACGSSNLSSEQESEAESEMEQDADTVDTEVRKPVSDVVGGTGIQGTWDAKKEADGQTNDIVLALNSDNTYGLYYGEEVAEKDTQGASATEFDGTYKDNGTSLEMTPNEVDDATTYSLGQGNFNYKLDGNTLTITDAQGKEIKFTRSETN